MIDLDQKVIVRWNPTTRKHFEDLGYVYTKHNDTFEVFAKDLTVGSGSHVIAECDYCHKQVDVEYCNYNAQTQNNKIKYACSKCVSYKSYEYGRRKLQTYEEFLNLCKELNLTPITSFDDFKSSQQEMEFECPTHGLQREKISCMRRFKHGCRQCGKYYMGIARKTITELIDECESRGYIILNPGDYISTNVKNLRVICNECNKEFTTTRGSIMSSQGRCQSCGMTANKHKPDEIKEIIESVNDNTWLNQDEYIDISTGNLRIQCGVCGQNEFTTSFIRYTTMNVNRCQSCSKRISKGELMIQNILDELQVEYIPQKRYDDCRDKSTLPFDFYLPKYNKIIEFDGQGHFEPIYGEDNLKRIQLHDNIKNEYCKANNIPILRIPYWDGNNSKNMIINFLELSPYPLIIKHYKNPYE